MDERSELRRKVRRVLGREIPEAVWSNPQVQEIIDECLDPESDHDEAVDLLVEIVEDRIQLVEEGVAEVLGGARVTRKGSSRQHKNEGGKLEADSFISTKTTAMLQAMSEFFTGLAHQHPQVVQFRKEVLGGRLLSPDEAHALVASYAARVLSVEQFAEWDIPMIGHRAEILDKPDAPPFNAVDHRLTIWIDSPGITKTVRYANAREGDQDTRCIVQNGAVVPIFTRLPIESHGNHIYPSWLWPGSVVDNLYELSEELATTFDWPSSAMDEFGRPRNEAASWFVLTGEAPEVRPLDARWITKGGSEYLNPQWRILLTVPPWLPEVEVSRAYRLMQQQILEGRNRLPDPKTLEVARFVWEQQRRNGYERPHWTEFFEQWREQYPGAPIKSYNNFRTICMRGVEAVAELNFSWPRPDETTMFDE
jgi:hypothetical protein